ncbi:polyamine ABC transporter substrate-binding protein [Parendozoicomonas haliclonae]|uniref:polyamine ABC transporter substrate-binding protein n=1 Tax=Parendozoicomonas haliclonae TaxID=1960125 RepID=UPI001F606394|nr:polyamine ABC transporter substrate-binding protein [Parendozoicomonas haliclonae]
MKKTLSALVAGISLAISVNGMASDDQQLNVANWSHYIAEDTVPNFQKQTGIKVNYGLYDSNEALEGRLLVGNSGLDVVVPSSYFLTHQAKAGVYEKLDKTRLPNWKNLDTGLLSKLALHDTGNTHAVPYMWGTSGIGYNAGKIKELLGENAPVDSWALVLDKGNAEKLAKCGITILDDPTDVLASVLTYMGKDPLKATNADWRAAGEKLKTIVPYVANFNSSQFVEELASGSTCVAIAYSGGTLQAAQTAWDAKNGNDIRYFIPKEGAPVWYDVLAMPADAPNKDNAYKFLNYMMEPEVIAEVSNTISYANANRAATPFVSESMRNNPGIYPSDEVIANLFITPAMDAKTTRLVNRIWTDVKMAGR